MISCGFYTTAGSPVGAAQPFIKTSGNIILEESGNSYSELTSKTHSSTAYAPLTGATFTGQVKLSAAAPTLVVHTSAAGTLATPVKRIISFTDYADVEGASIVADDLSSDTAATRFRFYVKNNSGTIVQALFLDGYTTLATFSGATSQAPVAFASLPAGATGMRALVNNALAPVFGAAVVGGGAVTIPVFHDGVSWKVG